MPISDKLIDQLLEGHNSPEAILGEEGLLKQLTKRVAERALQAEMDQHLGYDKHDRKGHNSGNSRNGKTRKSVRSIHGDIELAIPRDRNGSFEPQLVKKHDKQLNGFDDRIISLYAKGMTTRWQSRPLDEVYPIVYLDALVVRSRASGAVQNKHVYLALGVNQQGEKEILGLWMSENEGARFWLSIMTELKNRGLQDIFIACTDGLKGFPEAIEAVYPKTQIQLCIVHQVRHSLRYVSWKERKAVAADLRRIYAAATLTEAEAALEHFASQWDDHHPTISQSWRNNWERLVVFFDYPPAIRKVIYTTNAIESVNASLRKVTRNRRSFPTDEAVMKVLYLALHEIAKKWSMPIRDWKQAMSQFTILFGDRVSPQ